MVRIGTAVFLSLFAVMAVADGQSTKNASPAEQLAAIKKDQMAAIAAFRKAAGRLPDSPEGKKNGAKLQQAFSAGQAERLQAAVNLANADPKSEVAFAALEWVLTTGYGAPAAYTAMELLAVHHGRNPKLAKIVAIESLKKDYADTRAAFFRSVETLPDTPERNRKALELRQVFDEQQAKRLLTVVNLAKDEPQSDLAFTSLQWILSDPSNYARAAGKMALQLLSDQHAANPNVGRIVAWIGYHLNSDDSDHSTAFKLVKTVLEKSPDRAARGNALTALAWQAKRKFAHAEFKKDLDADALASATEVAFDIVLKDYANCPCLIGEHTRSLGDIAKQELFELRNLRIGKVAPDIEGEDLHCKKLKLSEYRGKITVVVFWATWCGSCMEMVPHERKLVARLKDQPFAMVGVNADIDRAQANQRAAKEEMTWRSFFDGDFGRISETWNVHAWPSIYVLDKRGVIRFRDVHGESLDNAIDTLLAERQKPPE